VACGVVEADHFYALAHRRVWAALTRLAARGDPLDNVTLGSELKQTGELEQIGGAPALGRYTDHVATVANVEHYARTVLEHAARRTMIATAREVVAEGYGSATADEYLDGARSAVTTAAGALQHSIGAESIQVGMHRLFDQLDKREENPDLIPIGIGSIKIAKGIPTILAARPSNGKSVTAMNIALNVASAGNRVLVFSLEDVRDVFYARAMAHFSGVGVTSIIERTVDLEQYPRVVDAAGRLSKLPIWVLDRTGVTSAWIRQAAAAHAERHGLDLVVVDYAQLMRDRGESRQDGLAEAMRGLGTMTRELHVAGLILSQIKRPDTGYRGNVPPPPTYSQLKGSGVLEEVAKSVILLHWPHYYDNELEAGTLWCRIAKHSNGPTGRRDLECDMSRMWVGDPGMSNEPAGTAARDGY
jgi:replicative DNA helicase